VPLFFRESPPVYDTVASPVCVISAKRESSRGFIEMAAEVPIWTSAEAIGTTSGVVGYLDGWLDATVAETLMVEALGGITKAAREELEAKVGEAEARALTVQTEADVLAHSNSETKKLLSGERSS
jgi:hypothetical protein